MKGFMWISRVLLCLGLMVGTLSMKDTLAHSWDPAFQATALPVGPTHSNYHAFREFTLSLGAAAVLLYVAFRPPADRRRSMWIALLITAVCYYGGWWLLARCSGFARPMERRWLFISPPQFYPSQE